MDGNKLVQIVKIVGVTDEYSDNLLSKALDRVSCIDSGDIEEIALLIVLLMKHFPEQQTLAYQAMSFLGIPIWRHGKINDGLDMYNEWEIQVKSETDIPTLEGISRELRNNYISNHKVDNLIDEIDSRMLIINMKAKADKVEIKPPADNLSFENCVAKYDNMMDSYPLYKFRQTISLTTKDILDTI